MSNDTREEITRRIYFDPISRAAIRVCEEFTQAMQEFGVPGHLIMPMIAGRVVLKLDQAIMESLDRVWVNAEDYNNPVPAKKWLTTLRSLAIKYGDAQILINDGDGVPRPLKHFSVILDGDAIVITALPNKKEAAQ